MYRSRDLVLATRFVSARELTALQERNLVLEEQATDLAARVSELEKEQSTAHEKALTERIAVLERERDFQRQLDKKEGEFAVLLGKIDFLERRIAEGPWGGGAQFDNICQKLEAFLDKQSGKTNMVEGNGDGAENHLELQGGPGGGSGVAGSGGGNWSGPTGINHPASNSDYAPIPAPVPVASPEDRRPLRNTGTGSSKWSWVWWTLLDKFFFDAIVGYSTNFLAARTSARMDGSMGEEIAAGLAKVLLDAKANATLTTATVTADATVQYCV